MNIKKTASIFMNFAIKRLAEIFGLIIFVLGVLLFFALFTYSPEDPNFIFPQNTEIKNILGFYGSFISDLFFQSIGLVAYLISITLIFTGINIFRIKEFFLIIENIFFTVIYSLFGSLFLSHFYINTFTFYINGNGGFVGNYFNQSFLGDILKINKTASFYLLLVFILLIFLVSINFHPIKFFQKVKKLILFFKRGDKKNYTDKSEIISEYIPQEGIKNLIQEDLPFINEDNKNNSVKKFKLPDLDLLKTPTK